MHMRNAELIHPTLRKELMLMMLRHELILPKDSTLFNDPAVIMENMLSVANILAKDTVDHADHADFHVVLLFRRRRDVSTSETASPVVKSSHASSSLRVVDTRFGSGGASIFAM